MSMPVQVTGVFLSKSLRLRCFWGVAGCVCVCVFQLNRFSQAPGRNGTMTKNTIASISG